MKSRGVYETPGGTVLRAAHRAVESLTLDREVLHLRDALVPRYAELVYYGYWFAPERRDAAGRDRRGAARAVTGTARLRLYKGSVRVVGRKAPRSLYDPKLASFEAAGGYRQADADGFIRLSGLRLRIQALVDQARPAMSRRRAARARRVTRRRGPDASPAPTAPHRRGVHHLAARRPRALPPRHRGQRRARARAGRAQRLLTRAEGARLDARPRAR